MPADGSLARLSGDSKSNGRQSSLVVLRVHSFPRPGPNLDFSHGPRASCHIFALSLPRRKLGIPSFMPTLYVGTKNRAHRIVRFYGATVKLAIERNRYAV